ncbi:MAG: T9SS type A sorting domain-containing protein [Bacteroidota bacterium]|nr:T9SS type A sorting domain-containing protein [Bacteroidota bacterium]
MKKVKILACFSLILFTATLSAQNDTPGLTSGILTPYSTEVRLMDSAYNFKWDTTSVAWSLYQKDYKNKNTSGLLTEDLYRIFLSSTNDWINKNRLLYTYFPGRVAVQEISGQLWNTSTSEWVDYLYTHYADSLRIDTTYTKTWDQVQHKFISGTRDCYLYDSLNSVILYTQQSMDPVSKAWVNSQMISDTFNFYENVLEEITKIWNINTESWVNNYRKVYQYDTTGYKLMGFTEYSWNKDSLYWENAYRTTYTLTMAGKRIQSLLEIWDPIMKIWVNSLKDQIIYTPDGYLGTDVQQVFDVSNQVWKNYYLTIHTYFTTGNPQAISGSFWNNTTWIQNSNHALDSVGHLIEDYSLTYNPETFDFTGGSRYSHNYDSYGNDTLYLVQTWNVNTSSWLNNKRNLYSYDPDYHLLKTDIAQNWKTNLSDWQNDTRWDYYYSDYFGVPEKQNLQHSCLYSNPLTYGSTIRCPMLDDGSVYDLALYSMTGSKLWNKTLNGNGSFAFDANVTPGIYILSISQKGNIISSDKVIVIR